MKFIIGLGNPGKQYESTRHNVGRDCVWELVTAGGFSPWGLDSYANAQRCRGELVGEPVELLLPETFMNSSGETARYLADKEGATPADIVVLHDDVDLALGEIKVSRGRGAGGQNGVQSIIDHLGSKDFVRVRIGIASKGWWSGEARRPAGGAALQRHVLGKFSFLEKPQLPEVYKTVAGALETLIKEGEAAAMNRWN